MPPKRKTERPVETADDAKVIAESAPVPKKTKKAGKEATAEPVTAARTSSRNKSPAISKEDTKAVEAKAKPNKKEEKIDPKDIEEDNTAPAKTTAVKRGASKAKKETTPEPVKEDVKSKTKVETKGKAGKKATKKAEKLDSDMEEEKENGKEEKEADKPSAVVNTAQVEEARLNGDLPVPTLKRQITDGFQLGDGKIPKDEIKISSWNVNGLRSVLKKGEIQNYLKSNHIDIICFNETKIDADKLNDDEITKNFPSEYHLYFNCCKGKSGYSGTGIATKYKPIAVQMDLNNPKHDNEGRTITLEFENFYLISCYVPNAGQKLERLDYRTKEWDVDFKNFIKGLKAKKHVIWCGDLNVAHTEKDIHNPKAAKNKQAGFTDRERQEFTNLLEEGFVDSFRELHPEEVKYSWWNLRNGARKTNSGWRLDYFVVDKEGMKGVKESSINNDVVGSDHCPIELLFNPNI